MGSKRAIQCPQSHLTYPWSPCCASWRRRAVASNTVQQMSQLRLSWMTRSCWVDHGNAEKVKAWWAFVNWPQNSRGEAPQLSHPASKRLVHAQRHPSRTVNSIPLNVIEPGSSERYPGLRLDPWTGPSNPDLLEKEKGWLQPVGKAALQPVH